MLRGYAMTCRRVFPAANYGSLGRDTSHRPPTTQEPVTGYRKFPGGRIPGTLSPHHAMRGTAGRGYWMNSLIRLRSRINAAEWSWETRDSSIPKRSPISRMVSSCS